MLLSPLAQQHITQARRQDFERDAQVRRARRIARRVVAACCAADASAAGTVDRGRPLPSRVGPASWRAAKAGA